MTEANFPRGLHRSFPRSHWPAPNLTMSELVTCKRKASTLVDLDQKVFLLCSWSPLKDMASSQMMGKKRIHVFLVKGEEEDRTAIGWAIHSAGCTALLLNAHFERVTLFLLRSRREGNVFANLSHGRRDFCDITKAAYGTVGKGAEGCQRGGNK